MTTWTPSDVAESTRDGLIPIGPGDLLQGSADFYAEERPVRSVRVGAFRIGGHPVTNAEYGRFVAATGHVTVAEGALDPADFPGADPALLVPGSLVFAPTPGPVPLDDWTRWWRWTPGADWRHPEGPDSSVEGRERHPVVHVAHDDALAYATWAALRLPTEAEWEYAARGGLVGATYAWGDEFEPGGAAMANTWRGQFPWRHEATAGPGMTTPVGTYPPNGYGLCDVAGNVWEWTDSAWTATHSADSDAAAVHCCAPADERTEETRMVIKGGSHLCAPSYCHRYRPAARQGQTIRSSTSHIGFRCAADA